MVDHGRVVEHGDRSVLTADDDSRFSRLLALALDIDAAGADGRCAFFGVLDLECGTGSADAAAVLVAVNALWEQGVPRRDLHALAAELGSDVPFALHGGTALGTGRGEELATVLARNTFHWVLAFGRGGLSTAKVFAEIDELRAAGDPPRLAEVEPVLAALATGDPTALAPLLGNELQAAALSLDPELRRTLRAGTEAGALAGIVSGSGPTCAFLCPSAAAAVQVGSELAGAGVCRTVRVASGPVHGARVVPASGA